MEGDFSIFNLALFASGNGTNVQRICEYFRQDPHIRPAVLFCNNPEAFVIERAERAGLPVVMIDKKKLNDPHFMLPALKEYRIDHIVLAGFLALVPEFLIHEYPDRILNIHPALLPKFGGKGMYGMNVHNAVVAQGEKESGITIHIVDERYDNGRTVFQARCDVGPQDSPEDVAEKIHCLEQKHFPEVIRQWVLDTRPYNTDLKTQLKQTL